MNNVRATLCGSDFINPRFHDLILHVSSFVDAAGALGVSAPIPLLVSGARERRPTFAPASSRSARAQPCAPDNIGIARQRVSRGTRHSSALEAEVKSLQR